jgi:predicted RNA methylase
MIEKLAAITQAIISPVLNYSAVREACNELIQFFYKAVDFEETKENNEHIITSVGLAVSPYSAAFCIVDFIRTRNFLLALKQAIEDKLLQSSNKPVIIFYAGTGPFATLVTPLTTVFNSNQIQFVLADINEKSITYLNKLIEVLHIKDYVIDIVKTDVSTYVLPNHHQPNILLSETMKPGLDKEPQVSIIANLIAQCKNNPILIPQIITVDLVLKGNRANANNEEQFVKNLIAFDASVAMQIAENKNGIGVFCKGLDVEIEKPLNATLSQLVLNTKIQLYKNIYLNKNETSLTIPHKICSTANFNYPVKYNIKYVIKEKPGFVFTPL